MFVDMPTSFVSEVLKGALSAYGVKPGLHPIGAKISGPFFDISVLFEVARGDVV
jgi:hypothetical protein